VIFFSQIKFIYTIHSNLNADKIKLFKKLARFKFISKKIKYVCISESIYVEFKKKFPQLNFILITNGINKPETSIQFPEVITEIESYKLNAQTKVFCIIGNYSGPKNFQLIVDVFSKFYEKKQNIILLIIGNDSTADKVEWKKIENQRSPNTFMLGLKSNVQDYLYLSDAYCLCSIYEGLPISILEAYSLGKPVLSTPAGGIPSILKEGVNGLLSSNFTLEAYYTMLLDFLKFSSEELNKISQNNLNDFKSNYTLDTVADKYIHNYSN
jgi:glycosyltransferase involved in cell wall biosynthesis